MKKFALILSLFFLLLSSGCGYIRYAKYPKIDIHNYEGQRYIGDDIILHNGYFMIYDNRIIVGRYLDLINCWSLAYFSNRDAEKNWLQGNGYHQAYASGLKEGFQLPNILETKISEARISCGNIETYFVGVEVKDSDIVISFNDGIRITDILDIENPYEHLEIDNNNRSCYFVLNDEPYLAWGINSEIVLYNDETYFSCGAHCEELDYAYYKIKDEYQEIFRNAINELNAMQE